jgi:cellulose synthase/poly-beta-1,6-N-acetylglucosamine synthase-like glycosyltransferase
MPPAKMVNNHDGFEVEFPPASYGRRRASDDTDDEYGRVRFAPASSSRSPTDGPVDLDDLMSQAGEGDDLEDDNSIFGEIDHDDDYDEDPFAVVEKLHMFSNPNAQGLLDNDASMIPGSPFSKPGNKRSTRPTEPLGLAKIASGLAFILSAGWVVGLILVATFNYNNIGRIILEVVLSMLAFLGLFWNTYFIVSSVCKCFIPAKAFKTNTKYCSIIPESKPEEAEWLPVTIQIPVYKESLQEVLMPTLKSCMKARDHYYKKTNARCNIVICDDGMMAFLRDNFAAAEMLWDAVSKTNGRMVSLSKLLKTVPKAARSHLRGMRSHNVYEVFHRMLFYYHYDIGFVARSAVDRRGKFKKASNLNAHLRLALGATQLTEAEADLSFSEALLRESHRKDGSRFVMFGNDIKLGALICVNDADARMSESVIFKTVPEFLNDASLGFTQHATKTMTEQRNETYFTNMLSVYTDALYQGHFLLSSIMGCHPPMVGHSIFLRTEAVRQCGRMRMLRHAQRWLKNIGLPFLPVDQIGFSNLHANNRAEYWSESHVSEDFELMIHLYNLGFNGRYVNYPDCEFEEGITRTFDEEAGRHRKFALGAHELVFNPFQEMIGHGVFTPLFRTFLASDIPSYYKVFLTAYLCSYATGGAYIIVFLASAIARLLMVEDEIDSIYDFSPASIIVVNIVAFYIIGYTTFLISLLRMHYINRKLLFPEYRKKCWGGLYIVFVKLRYCLVFQFFFYTVASITFYFLGSMDHMMSRTRICAATNKDAIAHSRCAAFGSMVEFNVGSWFLSLILGGLAYATVLQKMDWDPTVLPEGDDLIKHAMFAGPPIFFAFLAFLVPIILNPYILGWPFVCRKKEAEPEYPRPQVKKDALGRVVDIRTFMDASQKINKEMDRVNNRQDMELGTVRDLFSTDGSSPASPRSKKPSALVGRQTSEGSRMNSIPEKDENGRPLTSSSQRGSRHSLSKSGSSSDKASRHSHRSKNRAVYDV